MSCYATLPDDFYTHGLRAAALPSSVGTPAITAAITAASGRADGYLCGRFTMPLTAWGTDLTQAVCAIAAFELVAAQVGFNPEAGHNMTLVERKADALRWLEQVSRGAVTPMGVTDSKPSSTPGDANPSARAYSRRSRGWVRDED
jgi:phage gp36-like protein